MANVPMARPCFPWLEGSPWHGTWQLPTHRVSLSCHNTGSRSSSWQGGSQQGDQVQCASQHSHLLSSRLWDLRRDEPAGGWPGLRDWQTYQLCHRRHQGDHVPVPTAFCSAPEGKCSLLSSNFCQLRNVIAVAVVLCLIFYTFGNQVLRVKKIIIPKTIFMVLSSRRSDCESSPGSLCFWYMQNSIQWAPTFAPSQPTSQKPIRGQLGNYFHHHLLLLRPPHRG